MKAYIQILIGKDKNKLKKIKHLYLKNIIISGEKSEVKNKFLDEFLKTDFKSDFLDSSRSESNSSSD